MALTFRRLSQRYFNKAPFLLVIWPTCSRWEQRGRAQRDLLRLTGAKRRRAREYRTGCYAIRAEELSAIESHASPAAENFPFLA